MTVTTRQRAKSPQAADVAPLSAPPAATATSSSPKGSGTGSDADIGERPVREKLKQTSIAALANHGDSQGEENAVEETTADAADLGAKPEVETDTATTDDNRGRLRRKRSFEDVEGEHIEAGAVEKSLKHSRKRSRDIRTAPSNQNGQERKVSGNSSVQEEDEPPVEKDLVVTSNETNGTKDARPTTPELPHSTAESTKDTVMTSPNNKRTLEGYKDGHEGESVMTTAGLDEQQSPSGVKLLANHETPATNEERKPKRHRDSPPLKDEVSVRTEVPPTTESASGPAPPPADPLTGNKSPTTQPQTSSTAFAASGFSALANSSTSPFGALGSATGTASPFGLLGNPKPTTGGAFGNQLAPPGRTAQDSGAGGPALTTQKLTFATASGGPSAFGSAASGFGVFGGGLRGGGFGGGGGDGGFGGGSKGVLSTFASKDAPTGIVGLKDKPAKPFGAPAGDEEENGAGDDGGADEAAEQPAEKDVAQGGKDEIDKKDDRFFKQDLETGEEHECTTFSCRAKLYASLDRQWKERGVGTFKLNVRTDTESVSARFVMRAEGSHRVVLNSPVKKRIKIEDPTGGPPKGKAVVFMGFLEGVQGACLLQLKMKTNALATELHDRVLEVQEDMDA